MKWKIFCLVYVVLLLALFPSNSFADTHNEYIKVIGVEINGKKFEPTKFDESFFTYLFEELKLDDPKVDGKLLFESKDVKIDTITIELPENKDNAMFHANGDQFALSLEKDTDAYIMVTVTYTKADGEKESDTFFLELKFRDSSSPNNESNVTNLKDIPEEKKEEDKDNPGVPKTGDGSSGNSNAITYNSIAIGFAIMVLGILFYERKIA